MSNKTMIAQEMLYYDGIGRISKLLDQLCEGLSALHILSSIRDFPGLFTPLLVYTACLSPTDVSNAVYVDETLTSLLPGDLLVMAYLNQWISEASEECKFFCFCF